MAKVILFLIGAAVLLAAANPGFNKQAYTGAFSGDYQFWVNIAAFILQAFVASRLVKYKGVRGVLLALPLIALGGYAIIAAGVGFSFVRWIKTAENATDYSLMNTARQMLWLPTTREGCALVIEAMATSRKSSWMSVTLAGSFGLSASTMA